MGEIKPHHVAGFHVFHKAWYASAQPNRPPEIMIGHYDLEGGGTPGEFAIRWHDLGSDLRNVARLEVYQGGGWQALKKMDQDHGLLQALANLDGTMPGPEEMEALLLQIGLRDLTARARE